MTGPARCRWARRAALALLAVAAACSGGAAGVEVTTPTTTPAAPGAPLNVAVVGDSLTASAVDEIRAAFAAPAYNLVALDGVPGRRMVREDAPERPPGTVAITGIQAFGEPDVWVIALGTNDVGAQAGPEAFAADLRAVLDLIPDGTAVVWVDLWIRDRVDDVLEANGLIDDLVGERDRAVVVDWYGRAFADPSLIIADGFHLTDAGRAAFAQAMVDGVATLPRR